MKRILSCLLAGAVALAIVTTCRPEAPPGIASTPVVLAYHSLPDMQLAAPVYISCKSCHNEQAQAVIPASIGSPIGGLAGRDANTQKDYGLRLSKVRKYVPV